MEDIFYPSADGKTTVHAVIWKPEGHIKGVVQIIHGMAEYAARYAPFAEFLVKNGFAVCAGDHLGHGLSVRDKSCYGYFCEGGFETVLTDIYSLTKTVKSQFPCAPYFVVGHSMGSFFCRNFIARHGGEITAAVIMGTGYKDKLTINSALAVVAINKLFYGEMHRSKAITKLAFGSYNKKFKPPRTANDWLSVDAANVDKYGADEMCGFTFTDNGYKTLFSAIKAACSSKTFKAVRKEMPILFVSGDDDPVGDYGKGVLKSAEKMKKAGVKQVEVKLYHSARHEILNDFCKKQVETEILDFIERQLPKEA